MTINERTAALYDHLHTFSGGAPVDLLAILAAITESVAEEREACALIAANWKAAWAWAPEIATAIRARATHPEPPPAANPQRQPPRPSDRE